MNEYLVNLNSVPMKIFKNEDLSPRISFEIVMSNRCNDCPADFCHSFYVTKVYLYPGIFTPGEVFSNELKFVYRADIISSRNFPPGSKSDALQLGVQ